MWQIRLFFLFMLLWAIGTNAQVVSISSLTKDDTDLSALQRPVLDANNDTCALVKVVISVPEIDFDGNVVEKHKTSSSYWVYVIDGTRTFNMYHRYLIPIQISSQQHGITSFKGGKTYSVELSMSSELQDLLKEKHSDVKMTQKRFKMLELDRNYQIGDSLYREAMSARNANVELLKQASSLGWPLATVELLKMQRIVLPKNHSLVISQYETFDKYLDWLYHEIGEFDKILTKQYCEYRITFPNTPTDSELAIRRLEDRIKKHKNALRPYCQHKGGFSYNSSSPIESMQNMEVCIIFKNNPFDIENRELQYHFLLMKRNWKDIVDIASTLPYASFRGIEIDSN